MSSLETTEEEQNISCYEVSLDDFGSLLCVQPNDETRRKNKAIPRHIFYLRTEEGLQKVKRILVEVDDLVPTIDEGVVA